MVICKDLEHIQHFDKSVLTIGSLDGMHRGHIEIISELKAISKTNNMPSVTGASYDDIYGEIYE